MRTLIVTILLLAVTYDGISQTVLGKTADSTGDTITCLPNTVLRGAIKKIEGAKILQQEFNACKFSNALMERIIKVCDSTVREGKKADSLKQVRIDAISAERDNFAKQRDAAQALSSSIEKSLRRQRTATFTIAGIALSATFVVLLLRK